VTDSHRYSQGSCPSPHSTGTGTFSSHVSVEIIDRTSTITILFHFPYPNLSELHSTLERSRKTSTSSAQSRVCNRVNSKKDLNLQIALPTRQFHFFVTLILTMRTPSQITSLRLLLFALCAIAASGKGALYYNHWHSLSHSPSTYPYSNRYSRSRRSRVGPPQDYGLAALAARKTTKQPRRQVQASPEPSQVPDVSFDDLGPIGRTIAGVTQVAVTTAMEYVSGFFAGLALGTVVGMPGILFRPMEPGVPQMFMTEFKGRFGRMNSKSMVWAKSWGGISAAFGGFKIAIKVIRNGQEDEWNEIISSAAAGAFFGRAGKFVPVWTGVMT
jgi:hypothetical protein